MTRKFNQTIECPHCGIEFPQETAFVSWMRGHPELDSGDGILRTDLDHVIHRCHYGGNREIQCVMVVETKTHVTQSSIDSGRFIPKSQYDTEWIIDQVMRNRRSNTYKRCRPQSGSGPLWVNTLFGKSKCQARVYGVHSLAFSGTCPTDSATIWWDRKIIDTVTLIRLLRMDTDPDTLAPIDLRRHHKQQELIAA